MYVLLTHICNPQDVATQNTLDDIKKFSVLKNGIRIECQKKYKNKLEMKETQKQIKGSSVIRE